MEIKRTIDTTQAKYDLIGLTHEELKHLYYSYEKQWYVYCNIQMPESGDDQLLDKMRQMIENVTTKI